jgi:hypothetical protein
MDHVGNSLRLARCGEPRKGMSDAASVGDGAVSTADTSRRRQAIATFRLSGDPFASRRAAFRGHA